MLNPMVAYAGGQLDRASARRVDPQWIDETRRHPDSRVVPLWQDKCLVADQTPIIQPTGDAQALLAAPWVFLGLDGDAGVFAADLSAFDESDALRLTSASGALDVRHLVGTLDHATSATIAYARGLLLWHRDQQFCGRCGSPTESSTGGQLRICHDDSCGRLLFPRIEPAVITLVEAPSGPARCLLGRSHGADDDSFCTLAGFVEIGESFEDAVRREVLEEAGVEVGTVTYQASQPWPFPSGLMVGFRSRAVSEEISVDGEELVEARWFTRDELRERAADPHRPLFRNDSIERLLLESWLHETD